MHHAFHQPLIFAIHFYRMYTKEEAKQIRIDFWNTFGRRCETARELRGRKKKWILYDTKIQGIDLKFDADREHALVMIEVNSNDENRRLAIYEQLEKYKIILEEGFGNGLIWDICHVRESGQEVCRIYVELSGADFHNQHQWPDIYNFFIANMLLLENNFMEIRDIVFEEVG